MLLILIYKVILLICLWLSSDNVKLEPSPVHFDLLSSCLRSTFSMCSKSYDSSQLVGEKSSKIQKHDNMFKFNITELIKCELYILVLCHSQWKFCIYHVLHKNSNIWFIGHIMVQVTYINLLKNINKNIFEDTIIYIYIIICICIKNNTRIENDTALTCIL